MLLKSKNFLLAFILLNVMFAKTSTANSSLFDISSVSSKLLFNTVQIIAKSKEGDVSLGSAFFFKFEVEKDKYLSAIVANRHTIKNAHSGTFILRNSKINTKGETEPSTIFNRITIESEFEDCWICHPKDIDLCILPIGQIELLYKEKFKNNFFAIYLDEKIIPSEEQLREMTAMEDIIMLGYPDGLFDAVNNLPLIRRGVTSSHPAMDFNGKPEGVIDIAAFPGSSGSPILINNNGSHQVKNTIIIGSRTYLLGILWGGPIYTAKGKIETDSVNINPGAHISTQIGIHLGYYIKSRELLAFKNEILKRMNQQ